MKPFRISAFLILSFFSNIAIFAGSGGGGEGNPSFIVQMLPFIAIIFIFYFFIIRPQQKKQKLHKEMLRQLNRGDKVILSSGIHGKVEKAYEDKGYVIVSIADNVSVKVQKEHITTKTSAVGGSGKNKHDKPDDASSDASTENTQEKVTQKQYKKRAPRRRSAKPATTKAIPVNTDPKTKTKPVEVDATKSNQS